MLSEFSASQVAAELLERLERKRETLAGDAARTIQECRDALVPVRKAYVETELPIEYMDALENEVLSTVPARWRAIAEPYTGLEKRGFGTWRRGDLLARLTYVFAGLVVGGLIVAAPFIPIWEKWFPFLLSALAWFLPDAQTRWQKRAYAKQLGNIVADLSRAQPALDRHIILGALLPEHRPQPEKQTT